MATYASYKTLKADQIPNNTVTNAKLDPNARRAPVIVAKTP